MYDNLVIIASAIAGFISRVISSLITPWVNWQIEKARTKTENRKEKIKQWRMEIGRSSSFTEFIQTSTYAELKHRFSKDELKRFSYMWIDRNSKVDIEKSKLARFHEKVNEIEKEWGII
jgi:hypothetical protein